MTRKILIRFTLLVTSVGFQSCKTNTFPTFPIKVAQEFEIQIPVGFSTINEENWQYDKENKIGNISMASYESDKTDFESILPDLQYQIDSRGVDSDYELLSSDTVKTSEKVGIVKCYRKNENNSTYPVWTYHCFGVISFENKRFLLNLNSLGINFNPTVSKEFLLIKRTNENFR